MFNISDGCFSDIQKLFIRQFSCRFQLSICFSCLIIYKSGIVKLKKFNIQKNVILIVRFIFFKCFLSLKDLRGRKLMTIKINTKFLNLTNYHRKSSQKVFYSIFSKHLSLNKYYYLTCIFVLIFGVNFVLTQFSTKCF